MDLRTEKFKLFEILPEKARYYANILGKKVDEIELTRKGIPIDVKTMKIEEGERAAIRLITTPNLDRDNEILVPHGAMLEDFEKSPSVLWVHDYKSLPIGKDVEISIRKEGILAKTVYANHAFAEDVFQAVKGGFLNGTSVGFIPVEQVSSEDGRAFRYWQEKLEKDYAVPREESGKAKNIYTKWILLEHSDVPVPANAQALNLAVAKGYLDFQSERIKKDFGISEMQATEKVDLQSFLKKVQNFNRSLMKKDLEIKGLVDRILHLVKIKEKLFGGNGTELIQEALKQIDLKKITEQAVEDQLGKIRNKLN
jgi:hypothetical protein